MEKNYYPRNREFFAKLLEQDVKSAPKPAKPVSGRFSAAHYPTVTKGVSQSTGTKLSSK